MTNSNIPMVPANPANNVYIGMRYVPRVMGAWNSTIMYEPLSVVLYEGNSYTSTQYVPEGTPITDTTYWVLTGNFNAQYEVLKNQVDGLDNQIAAVESTANTALTQSSDALDAIAEINSRMWVNAKDYGAVGDGTTDDTDALNTFLEYVASHNCTGYIPAGTYLVSSSITMRHAGSFSIIGDPNMNTKILRKATLGFSILDLRNCNPVCVQNLVIDANGQTTGEGAVGRTIDLVDINNSPTEYSLFRNIQLVNTNFCGIEGYTALDSSRCYNVTFENIQILGTGTMYPDNHHPWGTIFSNFVNASLSNFVVKNMGTTGIGFKNYCRNCRISNAFIDTCVIATFMGGSIEGGITFCSGMIWDNIITVNCNQSVYAGQTWGVYYSNCLFGGIANATLQSVYLGSATNTHFYNVDIAQMQAAHPIFRFRNSTSIHGDVRISNTSQYAANVGDTQEYCRDIHLNIACIGNNAPVVSGFSGDRVTLAFPQSSLWYGPSWTQTPLTNV